MTENIIKTFKDYINSAKSKWEIEKKSDPINIYKGQEILKTLCDEITDISYEITPMLNILNEDILKTINSNIIKLKKHLDYNVYLDSGKSSKKYWKIGDEIIGDFIKIINELNEKWIYSNKANSKNSPHICGCK